MRAIGVSHTACIDEFRRNLRSHSWSVFSFFMIIFSGFLRTPLPRMEISQTSLKLLFFGFPRPPVLYLSVYLGHHVFHGVAGCTFVFIMTIFLFISQIDTLRRPTKKCSPLPHVVCMGRGVTGFSHKGKRAVSINIQDVCSFRTRCESARKEKGWSLLSDKKRRHVP